MINLENIKDIRLDPIDFVIHFLVFTVLCAIIFIFAYKPFKNFLKKRNDYIKKNIDESLKNKLISEEKLEKINKQMIDVQNEIDNIITNTRKKTAIEYELIINKARIEANKQILEAQKKIDNNFKQKEKEIKNKAIDMAYAMCYKVLEHELKNIDNKKRIDIFMSNITKDDEQNNTTKN